jgi:DNA ligase 1
LVSPVYTGSMKLPTIYKKTKTGKVQEWTIEVKGNQYRTISGQTDGEKITNEWTDCDIKNAGRANATTPEEQAIKEAEAKRKKKLESGYFESIKDINKVQYFEPMLAQKYEDHEINYPVYSQPKLDGIRCIVTKDGMFSRNGKKIISAPHIRQNLDLFFKDYPNAILDGELYCDKFANDFNKICSLVKRTKPTDEELKESADSIQYWVYDAPKIGLLNEKDLFFNRYELVSDALSKRKYPSIVVVTTLKVSKEEELTQAYEMYVEHGYEGQMVRLNRPYENKRSKFLLKRKEFMDEEFNILDVVEGEGNRKGTAGYMVFKNKDGRAFKSNIKGDFDYLAKLLKDKNKIIGKKATIKFFNYTPDEVPRFPYVIAIDRDSYE